MASHEEINQSSTDNPESTILAEQVLLCYSAINTTIVATLINASILIFILWSVIEHEVLLIWLTVIVLVSLSRGITAYQYKMAKPHQENALFWMRRFLVGSSLASLVWGASAIWLFPADDLARQVFIAFVVGGMAAGAVTSLSYIKIAIYFYLGFSLIPLLIVFFYTGTELGIAMGVMLALYLVMLVIAANRNHASTKQNISLKFKSIERERLLQSKTEQLQSVISNAPLVLWSLDKNGLFTLSEGSALKDMGLKSGQVVGQSVFDLYADYPEVINVAKRALLGESLESENEVGGRYYISHYTPRYDEQNNIIGCIGVAVDITERKKTETILLAVTQEAQRANQAKSEFLSHMSHELRTPMNAILGFSQLLSFDETLTKEQKSSVQEIMGGGSHLLNLISEILDLAKIEAGKLEISPEDCNLNKILDESLSLVNSLAAKHGIQLNNDISLSSNYNIYVDYSKFKQVMINLLSNAIKYNSEKGKVTLNCEVLDNNYLRINVIDQGQGINEQDQQGLFKSFERFGKNKGIDGVGIGLVITKNLIEAMSGKIGVESKSGRGSRFFIDVPLS